MNKNNYGKLFIVSTPIGNLLDITLRAIETLKNVDIIACENKSKSKKLLSHFNINKKIIEYSPKNELNSTKGIIKLLIEGKNIALISDAGTPLISDPGKILINEALAYKINIIPIPGVSALTNILSICEFPIKRIVFLGFLPKSSSKIAKEIIMFKNIECILILFVSYNQIKKILEIVNKILGNVEIIIGREMTKLYEEYIRGKILDIDIDNLKLKGEYTLAIANRL